MDSYPSDDLSMTEPDQAANTQARRKKSTAPFDLGRWTGNAWRLSILPMLAFFLIPLVVVFLQTTPARITASLLDPQVYKSLAVSLKTTLISLGLTLLLGTPVAFLIGQVKFRAKNLVETLVDLPTVLPPSVAGLALLLAFGRNGVIGSVLSHWGISLAFTQAAVVMAQIFIASPYYIRAASIGFGSIDREYIEAAELDGAGPWQLFRYIILPMARYSLLSGGVMSWARALGEFGATIMFAGNFLGRTQTMPLAIYLGFESNLEAALTLSVILIAISCVSLIVARFIAGRITTKMD
jgi:molybdate transport system permease protein